MGVAFSRDSLPFFSEAPAVDDISQTARQCSISPIRATKNMSLAKELARVPQPFDGAAEGTQHLEEEIE